MNPLTLDLSQFNEGSEAQRERFSGQLRDGLTQHGFVKVVGHGIPKQTVAELFGQSKKFFELGPEDKLAIAHPGGREPQRGWSAIGNESSSALYRKGLLNSQITEDLKDAREHFDQGSTTDVDFPTRWPDENTMPGFRLVMEDAFEKLEQVAGRLMAALEVAFQLPAGAFLNAITHDHNSSELRLNHYPDIEVDEILRGKVSRIWPHFDLGVITLLFQDSVGGLEFEDREQAGEFYRLHGDDTSELVVNVSETLQRWTNGVVRAGLHRVSLPQNLDGKTSGTLPERYSIAYFCKADRLASVGPLGQFVKGCEARYSDISAIEYHQQRLQSAY